MNEMRKLLEALERIEVNEGWDPKLIAGAIFDEAELEGSPLKKAADSSPEPIRAMIYEFGNLTGFYNPAALDGSEIYHEIVDELERLSVEEDEYHLPIEEDEYQFEAYDEEIDGQVEGNAESVLRELIRELQILERNTSRVYREATQSKNRPDFAEVAINELGMTLTDITNLVEKYEDY